MTIPGHDAEPARLTLDSTVAAAKEQISCELGEEGVVLHLGLGTYFGLNQVGNAVWNLVQQPRTVAEVRDHLLRHYQVAPAECEQDLLELLEDMAAAGLLEVSDAAGA
jgi:hypothetical protein